MLSPKKVIPPLALAALPLTGFGCGGSAGNPPDVISSAYRAFCLKIAECYPEDVGGTVEQCTQYYSGYYSDLPEGCQLAIASYFQCLGELTCDEYANDYEQCSDAVIDDVIAACPAPTE